MQEILLSILIPSRGEEFLNRTIQDILENSSECTEIVAVMDGDVSFGVPLEHPRLKTIVLDKSIGQRAATNLAAKNAKGIYLAKSDAHCKFDKDFDKVLLRDIKPNQIVVPLMKNLHAFDWVCPKGHRRYQSPSGPCIHRDNDKAPMCGLPTEKDVVWIAKKSPNSTSYSFDPEPHFFYFKEFSKRPEGKVKIPESMSLQGSFFMCSAKDYWRFNLSDEQFGSWGSQGIEISQKFHLTGGEVRVNTNTWYAHLFRTQGGDFGFPYKQMPHSKIVETRGVVKDYFYRAKFPKQVYPVSRVLEKFWPIYKWEYKDYIEVKRIELQIERSGLFSIQDRVTGDIWVAPAKNIKAEAAKSENQLKAGAHPTKELQEAFNKGHEMWWHVELFCQEHKLNKHLESHKPYHPIIKDEPPLTKGILYYTDSRLDEKIAKPCRDQIKKARLPITSVSLKPLDFGNNIVVDREPSVETMVTQILTGLKAMKETVVHFAEHDCVYHQGCWDVVPPNKETILYNTNVWKINVEKGYGVKVDDCRQLSGLCAYRDTLIAHYEKRLARIKETGYSTKIGHEVGTHNRAERIDDLKSETWSSYVPMLDLRHSQNQTATKWHPDEFRNKKFAEGWQESSNIPSYGDIKKFLKKLGL